MDARQRLNQLRRSKSKFNPNKKRLTDLRELIARNDNKSIKGNKNPKNSVKTRIGFKTKNYNQMKNRQLITNKDRRRDNPKQINKRIGLQNTDQRLPTVVVDLSQIGGNRSHASMNRVAGHSLFSSRNEPKSKARNESKNSVLVSNLNQTITDSDINELFGEIGPILKSSKINSSVALIHYQSEEDARKACHTYHNRLLDGIPMQCNTLSLSNDEYDIRPQPQSQALHPRGGTSLLTSQFQQINSMYSQPIRGQTMANKRTNRSNARFVVNV